MYANKLLNRIWNSILANFDWNSFIWSDNYLKIEYKMWRRGHCEITFVEINTNEIHTNTLKPILIVLIFLAAVMRLGD